MRLPAKRNAGSNSATFCVLANMKVERAGGLFYDDVITKI